MKAKLKQKEVIAIWWDNKHSQEDAIEQLKEIGTTNIEVHTSGAGISIDFQYPTPNSHKPIYYGSMFYGMRLVFDNNGTYPKAYSSKEFEDLYEIITE